MTIKANHVGVHASELVSSVAIIKIESDDLEMQAELDSSCLINLLKTALKYSANKPTMERGTKESLNITLANIQLDEYLKNH